MTALPFKGLAGSIAGRLLAGYTVVILLLVLTWAVGAYNAGQVYGRATQVVNVNDALLNNVTERAKLLDDEETGLRGYLLTRNRSFLDPYLAAQLQIPSLQEDALVLGERLPAVLPLLTALSSRDAAWERWAQSVILHPPIRLRSSDAIASEYRGKSLFDRYRLATAHVIGTVEADRSRNLNDSKRIRDRLYLLSAGIFLAACLITALIGWATLRAVTRPLRRLSAAAETIGDGQLGDPVAAEGAREFSGLAKSMEHMRMRLAHGAERRDRAEESLRKRATLLSNVVGMQSIVAAAGPNLQHILHLVAEQAQSITNADGVVIELVEGDEMVYRAATGTAAGSLGFRLISDTDTFGMSAKPEELLRSDDTESDPRVDRAACRQVGARSIIIVPLRTDAGMVGVLNVLSSRVHAFDDNDADTLRLIAGEIAGAMRTAAEFDVKQALLVERSEVAEELSLANAELESFAYSVSHDLRAPLRSLDGFSQLLLERNAAQLDDRGKRYLGHVRDAAQEMGQLIDAVLALTRVTRGDLRDDRVDLSEIARSIVADLSRSDPQRKVSVRITDDIVTGGDERLLRVVLQNLLGNAWKFTSKRPDAQIEFSVEEQDGLATCFVRDNGAGFDMEYVDKLFGPFQRLHGTSDFEGTGVGLATVQRIIRRHGGRVWAEGEVDRGATFYFTIPKLQKEAPCKAAAS